MQHLPSRALRCRALGTPHLLLYVSARLNPCRGDMLTPNQFMAALLDSNPINLYPFLGLLSDGTMMMTAYNRTYLYTYISPYGLLNSTAAPVPDLPHPVPHGSQCSCQA